MAVVDRARGIDGGSLVRRALGRVAGLLGLVVAMPGVLVLMPATAQAAPGDLDPTFGDAGKVTTAIGEEARAVAVQPDGKIILAGYADTGVRVFAVTRYNPDGTLDSTFGTGGTQTTTFGGNSGAYAVAVQPDGKIVLGGSAYNGFTFAVARYNADGTPDLTFGVGGIETTSVGDAAEGRAMALQPDGKIVLAGYGGDGDVFAAVRYNSDATLDPSFGSGGIQTTAVGEFSGANAVAIQSDGTILLAGWTDVLGNGDHDFAMLRYDSDGSLDPTFGTGGMQTTAIGSAAAEDAASAMAVLPDGKILVGGYTTGDDQDFALARYEPDGSLDTGFGTGGKQITEIGTGDDAANAMAVQPDGKIVLGGYAAGADRDFAVVRYEPDGSLDTGFGTGGKRTTEVRTGDDAANAIAVQADGKIILAGYSNPVDYPDFAAVRYGVAEDTTTAVAADPATAEAGQEVTFTAEVAAASGTPTGSVVFTIEGVDQPPVTLSSGQASVTTDDLTAGTHTIEAAYTPDTALQLASTDTLTYQVTQPADEPTEPAADPTESTTSDTAAPTGQGDTVGLASTGTDISGLVPIGALALATGAVLVAVRRKRSKSS
jgi:uncharacterized delta-60 repeat protein/LPXTG-motif cell wall-anchored protein